jgi:diadenosine tetraphosphate (Ap4A) HIT family hydrolase
MRRYLTGTRAFKIYQDDLCMPLVIHHQTPVHFLVIPKNRDGLTQWTNYWDI